MKHTPQRPFVPTPGAARRIESAGTSAFRIPHPFVHEVKPAPAKSARPAAPPPPLPLRYEPPAMEESIPLASPSGFREADALPPIEQYLDRARAAQSEPPGIDEYAYELPPVEHFMDAEPGQEVEPLPDTSEWSADDWQQFDWRSAASLGEASDPAANNAWSDTDWGKAPPQSRNTPASAAKALADALDGIVRRIREGDLSLPSLPPGSAGNPADIAATLAALLGVKR